MPFKDLDREGMDPPGPVTESAEEQGLERDVDDEELGQSEELDGDDIGDIADEGPGHRG
ncbi:MAG: hypothetical protein HY657_19045 [Acidobacteria bacterium]|nr:hypothetical protein [Acidobacteriota bacterium]